MKRSKAGVVIGRIAAWVGSLAVIAVIIWADIRTGIWSELVVLSGLAAGLVSFLLTVLVLNRLTANATARKWAPVSRLALTEMLHAMADEDKSEISRGLVVRRTLKLCEGERVPTREQLDSLRSAVVSEREAMADVLGRWSPFLASAGDNEEVMRHVAVIALYLDRIRDLALETEKTFAVEDARLLREAVCDCNERLGDLESELRQRIAALPVVV